MIVNNLLSVIVKSIFSNLHLIRDTLDMINKTDETGILVTLDQMKAFDRVDHDFLMRVLLNLGSVHPFVVGFQFFIRMSFYGSFVTVNSLLLFS